MATAVTLKESDGSEIYPVTDISLVNGGISAHDILPASSVAPITTDQIQNRAVTTAKLSGMPGPDFSNTLNNWGTITSTTTKSITADGYICGKAIISGADSSAYITINTVHVAGFPYNGSSSINNLQASFCLPVKKGMSVVFSTGSGGQFQAVKQVGWTM